MPELTNYIGHHLSPCPQEDLHRRLFLSIAEENHLTADSSKLEEIASEIQAERDAERRYRRLTTGSNVYITQEFLEEEFRECLDEAREEYFTDLILDSVIRQEDIRVTYEEALEEAKAIAARQDTTLEFVVRFFGEDLKGIHRDLQRRRAEHLIMDSMVFISE